MKLNPKVFWGNVKHLREEKGFTQQKFADLIDYNYKNYSNKERGLAANVDMYLAQKVAEALETTIEDLGQGDESEFQSTVAPNVAAFWRNLRTRREELGKRQVEIADKLGISANNYSTKEALKAPRLSSKLMQDVASALETTVEALTGSEQLQPRLTPVQSIQPPVIVEKPRITKSDTLFDLGHLPKRIREFIADPKNKDEVIDMFLDS